MDPAGNMNILKRANESENFFQIFQINCNSLSNKLSEFKIYLYSSKPDIVCLCETMIKKHEPKFIGYSCFWKHRNAERGGLAVLIRHDIV